MTRKKVFPSKNQPDLFWFGPFQTGVGPEYCWMNYDSGLILNLYFKHLKDWVRIYPLILKSYKSWSKS